MPKRCPLRERTGLIGSAAHHEGRKAALWVVRVAVALREFERLEPLSPRVAIDAVLRS